MTNRQRDEMKRISREVLLSVGQEGGDLSMGEVCVHRRKPATDAEIGASGWSIEEPEKADHDSR